MRDRLTAAWLCLRGKAVITGVYIDIENNEIHIKSVHKRCFINFATLANSRVWRETPDGPLTINPTNYHD